MLVSVKVVEMEAARLEYRVRHVMEIQSRNNRARAHEGGVAFVASMGSVALGLKLEANVCGKTSLTLLMRDALLMTNWIRHFRQKWDDWCGDRDMEISIRNHLSHNGYFGKTARFEAVRLVAVQRPGWLQVYRFEVNARVDPASRTIDGADEHAEYRRLFGLVREDHRHNRSDVRVFQSEVERIEVFRRWSDGLVCLRGAKGLVSS